MSVEKAYELAKARYAAFGMLLEGFEVLDSIAAVDTAPPEDENRPIVPQIIESIRVL